MSSAPASDLVFVGTYTERMPHVHGKAAGIGCFRFERASGRLTHLHTTTGVANPSFLAIDHAARRLYAVCEVATHRGSPGGSIHAFAIEGGDGRLRAISEQTTHGLHPCHVSIDLGARGTVPGVRGHAIAANYSTGSLSVFPIREDGTLEPASEHRRHEGRGPNPVRQEGPHVHASVHDAEGRWCYVPDLGCDGIRVFHLDRAHGRLVPHPHPMVATPAGTGPRHLAIHPNGRFAYATLELERSVAAFRVEADGRLTLLESLSAIPDQARVQAQDFIRDLSADIHVHPNGRWLYASNRGHDSLTGFAIGGDGRLRLLGCTPCGGMTPRAFAIDRSGTWLLCAHQDSDAIVSFRIGDDGSLREAARIATPTPVAFAVLDGAAT